MLAEEFEARAAVVINEENILTVVAVLKNVVRLTLNDNSGHTTCARNLPLAGRRVNQRVTVSLCSAGSAGTAPEIGERDVIPVIPV